MFLKSLAPNQHGEQSTYPEEGQRLLKAVSDQAALGEPFRLQLYKQVMKPEKSSSPPSHLWGEHDSPLPQYPGVHKMRETKNQQPSTLTFTLLESERLAGLRSVKVPTDVCPQQQKREEPTSYITICLPLGPPTRSTPLTAPVAPSSLDLPEFIAVTKDQIHVLVESLEGANEDAAILQDAPHPVVNVLQHLAALAHRLHEESSRVKPTSWEPTNPWALPKNFPPRPYFPCVYHSPFPEKSPMSPYFPPNNLLFSLYNQFFSTRHGSTHL